MNEFSPVPRRFRQRLMAVAAALALPLWFPCLYAQPAPGSFTLSLAPPQRIVVQGGWQDMGVQVTRAPGFTGPVSLSLQGAPAGVTAVFERNPVTTRSTKVTLRVDATVPVGSYSMFIQGISGVSQQTMLQLTVTGTLPVPSVSVDSSLRPDFASLPGPDPAHPRVVAALADAKHKTHFVQDELIVATNDSVRFTAFLKRWSGTVVLTLASTSLHLPRSIYLVHIDPSLADLTRLPVNLQKTNPNVTGAIRFSDMEGARLLAAAAEESAGGLDAELNPIAQSDGTFLTGISHEAAIGLPDANNTPYSSNVFDWGYMKQMGEPGLGVTHAWQGMELAGKLGNQTTVAIIEQGGFAPNTDFPPFAAVSLIPGQNATMVANPTPTGSGTLAPWHGTWVSEALTGVAGNGFGAAGTAGAGPNANLLLITAVADNAHLMEALLVAETSNAKIINISSGGKVPAVAAGLSLGSLNDVTTAVRGSGVLIFAAAGNSGENVDLEDCFGACWEETWYWPCENDGVICVGGLAPGTRDRDPGSNYGSGHVGDVSTVDIWAPFQVLVGPDPFNPVNQANWVGGTSFSSPYVAGVAAMIRAANPALIADFVEEILYSTAAISYDPTVSNNRIVLADQALMAALGNLPPRVTITAPGNNSSVEVGFFNPVTLTADALDFEDGAKCCKITWSSNVDNFMGSGAQISYAFLTPGTRTVTATAEDMSGASAIASIKITASYAPPVMTILKPSPGTILYRNVTSVFDGQGIDPNNFPGTLPCSGMVWKSNKAGDQQIAGTCHASFVFATLGTRTITLTGKNSQFATGAAAVTVTVVDAPPGLYVTITSPAEGAVYDPKQSAPLSFTFSGAQGLLSSFQWRILVDGLDLPIKVYPSTGPGFLPTWIPSDYLNGGYSSGILSVYVTDGTGNSGSDHKDVNVVYPTR